MQSVLIVDDDPLALTVVRDHLQPEGYFVYTAEDWTAMNAVLFANRIAVLILDIRLPGLDGDALAQIVQRNLEFPPRIVLHSGIEVHELRRLATKVGAFDYIPKGSKAALVRRIVSAAVKSFLEEHGEHESHPARKAMYAFRDDAKKKSGGD